MILKRTMTLVVVMAVLLFTQSAFAEWEFHPGELMEIIQDGEVQEQGLIDPQAAFKVVPLQVYTHAASGYPGIPLGWWYLNQQFYETVLLAVYGSGNYTAKITVTDVKTGMSESYKYPQTSITEGYQWLTYGPTMIGPLPGQPTPLPRVFNIKYTYKVGTTAKSVSCNITIMPTP
jgi:hypothetical protein